jgi:hypothetical protein
MLGQLAVDGVAVGPQARRYEPLGVAGVVAGSVPAEQRY